MEKEVSTGSSYKPVTERWIAALLNPRPAVLVTCCSRSFVPNVLTVAWQTPLSHTPPLVGISIDFRRYSYELISHQNEFVINVMGLEFRRAIEFCGEHSGREVDKFTGAGLTFHPAVHVHPPVIAGALAHLECKVVNQVVTGDHTFFVGEVIFAEALTDNFSDGWNAAKAEVLLCLNRNRYTTWR